MGIVTAHMSMSLDGFVAGPNAGAGNPLGDEGVLIQQWMFDLASFREMQGLSGGQTNKDDEELRERFAPTRPAAGEGGCRATRMSISRAVRI
jgi:hypothetical protein